MLSFTKEVDTCEYLCVHKNILIKQIQGNYIHIHMYVRAVLTFLYFAPLATLLIIIELFEVASNNNVKEKNAIYKKNTKIKRKR